MPTYEYRCADCGADLEVVQAFTDDALTECPTCGGALRKLFGSVGISFKGSGFYKNDARSAAKKSSDSSSKDKKDSSSSSDSSSGDSSSSSDSSSKDKDSSSKDKKDSKSSTSSDSSKKSEVK